MSTPTQTDTTEIPSKPCESKDEKSLKESAPEVDSELDAILDSALADFDKKPEPVQPPPPSQPEGLAANGNGGKAPLMPGGEDGAGGDDLNYDSLADDMSRQFEECFSHLLSDPALKKQFEDLSRSAEEAATDNNPDAFTDAVEKTLAGMNLNAENIQGEELQKTFEQMTEAFLSEGGAMPGMGDDAGGSGLPSMEGLGPMGGMFQTMVQQLLSKELLYQPLKDVTEKYREYLSKNEASLDADTLSTYRQQVEVIDKVVTHLDGDSDGHSAEEKGARFEVLLELLQKMHELGNPPKEVVGEGNMMMPNLPDLASMGMGGFPGMPGMPGGSGDPSQQCCLM